MSHVATRAAAKNRSPHIFLTRAHIYAKIYLLYKCCKKKRRKDKTSNVIFIKGTDISKVKDGKISRIRRKINARSGEKLDFYIPAEVFFKNFRNVELAG